MKPHHDRSSPFARTVRALPRLVLQYIILKPQGAGKGLLKLLDPSNFYLDPPALSFLLVKKRASNWAEIIYESYY